MPRIQQCLLDARHYSRENAGLSRSELNPGHPIKPNVVPIIDQAKQLLRLGIPDPGSRAAFPLPMPKPKLSFH